MSTNKITVQREGHVLMIGLNRPEKMNAYDVDMFWGLAHAFGELDADKDLRCGVLFAHGDHVTSGLDLPQWAEIFAVGEMPPMPAGCIDPMGYDEERRLSKPMVMAAQGRCYTVGWELMLTTDVRVAADTLRLAQLEVKRGIFPVGGATVRLMQEIGWANAQRYILTGDEMNAAEAYRLGLVQEVVEHGKQLDKALEIATRISKQAPLGVQAALLSSRHTKLYGDKVAMARLIADLKPIMVSQDSAEGVQAFLERREANFKGC